MTKPLESLLGLMPPQDDEFFGKDFMPAEALDSLARELTERHEELNFIRDHDLQVLWKRSGGSKGGRGVLGKCSAPSGLTRFYSGKDWVIWLAADHVRAHGFNAEQTEALLYHEMLHCAVEKEGDRPEKITTVSHDIEAFNKEIERYGLWMQDLVDTAAVMGQQLALQLDTPGAPD